MAQSLATAVRRRNVDITYAALMSNAPLEPETVEGRTAIHVNLMRRAEDLRSWALAECGTGLATESERRAA